MISTGSTRNVALPWMCSPGITAILTQLLFRDSLRELGWRPGPIRYPLLGYAVPWIYGLVIYTIVWFTGLAAQPLSHGAFGGTLPTISVRRNENE
jgi:hypothetical protein